jgi:hypothetical protein
MIVIFLVTVACASLLQPQVIDYDRFKTLKDNSDGGTCELTSDSDFWIFSCGNGNNLIFSTNSVLDTSTSLADPIISWKTEQFQGIKVTDAHPRDIQLSNHFVTFSTSDGSSAFVLKRQTLETQPFKLDRSTGRTASLISAHFTPVFMVLLI